MAYDQTLPNFSKILNNNCSLLKIDNRLKHVFKEQPITAYCQNRNLRYMIGYITMEINKAVREQKPIFKIGYDKPYFLRRNNLCCKHIVQT